MSLTLTDEQSLMRDSVRDFLREHAPVSQLRALRDRRDADGFSRELWREFAAMGFCGVTVPEALGGLGLGPVEAGLVMEQIGRQLAASPFLASSVVAVAALRAAGSPGQQQAWLPRLAAGEAIATLAIDEGSKHRPDRIALRATPSASGGLRLDGEKTLVLDGHVADVLIVAARSSGESGSTNGMSLCLVERGAAGVEIERTVMVDAHNAARVRLNGVEVSAEAVLGPVGGAWPAIETALDAGRLAAAAELLGLADEAFERTVDYLKQRRQFDRLIGEFQALQHRAAQVYTELELTRAAVIAAQQRLATGAPGAHEAIAVAKARAGRSATLAVQEGVQMHGGIGMTDEFEMGFFMKRARVLQELFGDAHYHQDQIARGRGY